MQIPGGIRALTIERVTITPWSLKTSIQSLSLIPSESASLSFIHSGYTPRDNVVMRWLTGVKVHDLNCLQRAMQRRVFEDVLWSLLTCREFKTNH